jgi:imidazolonepropionase-like amidohydrolase
MAEQRPPLVIRGGRLIDGNGGKPADRATLVIEKNRIQQVASGTAVTVPKEAVIIDAQGKTVLPGLIDNHVHYRDLLGELFIAHGVTSVRDLGNALDWILLQRDAVAMGKIRGPRIFCAGGGFYAKATSVNHIVPADAADARRMTRQVIAQGVDYLKVHMGVSLDIIRAIADEGRAAGFKLSGHLDSSILPYAEAGVDGVEHATGCAEAAIRSEEGKKRLASVKLWLAKFLAPWALAERSYFPEVTERLARWGTFIEPTNVLWGASLGKRAEWEREDYELLKNPGLSYLPQDQRLLWLDHFYLAYGARANQEPESDVVIGNRYSIYGIYPGDQLREGHLRLAEFLCRLVKAGGHVVTGTDAPAVTPGISMHREMEFLVDMGLTPMQAIMAATKIGAEYLGAEKDLGTIEQGKLADLIVVDGDPLKNIRDTRNIVTVIKDGEVMDLSYHVNFTNPIPRPHSQEFYGYPIPTLDTIAPRVGDEYGDDTDILVKGKNFFPVSVVYFGGAPIPSTFVSQTELRATIPAHLLRVGTIRVSVVNPKPHEFTDRGATSNALPFMVRFRNPAKSAH